MGDVRGFAKDIFTHSFLDSADRKDTTPAADAAPSDSLKINFSEYSVSNTAVSVQLVLWSLTDESGTVSIYHKTSDHRPKA